jgi:hypothetical protein
MAIKKRTSSKSKDELLTEIDKLKNKLKELKNVAVVQNAIGGDLNEVGLGLVKREGKYKLVEILYNDISGEAKVTKVEDASRNPLDASMALMEGKKFLVENILNKAVDGE